MKPRIFVGSSGEGLPVAEALVEKLSRASDPVLWTNVFPPGKTTVESIDSLRFAIDFAILVFTPDDLTTWRGSSTYSPRDNVVLEFGYFFGAIGRERTFVLHGPEIERLPSDLAGVQTLTYPSRDDGNLPAGLDSVLHAFYAEMQRLGPVKRNQPSVYWAGPHRNVERNREVRSRLAGHGVSTILPGELASRAPRGTEQRRAVRQACIDAIVGCDSVLVDLDRYGMDTAWEIGYAEAIGKRVFGLSVDGHIGSSVKSSVSRREFRDNIMHGWDDQEVVASIKDLERVVEGRAVHVCGPFANEAALTNVRNSGLGSRARKMVLPGDILSIRESQRDRPWIARNEAIGELEGCDLAVVLLPRYGMDTSWQIGYATGTGMDVVGLHDVADRVTKVESSIWEHWMHGWSEKVHLVSLADAAAIAQGEGASSQVV